MNKDVCVFCLRLAIFVDLYVFHGAICSTSELAPSWKKKKKRDKNKNKNKNKNKCILQENALFSTLILGTVSATIPSSTGILFYQPFFKEVQFKL